MSAKQIRELGSGEIPASLYPEGWLEWATEPERRVNLNRCQVWYDTRRFANSKCLFTGCECDIENLRDNANGSGAVHIGRLSGRPVRVYVSREPGEEIPF